MRLFLFLASLACAAAAAFPWPPAARARASSLVAQMTLAEKLSLMQGSREPTYAGTLPAIPRLGIPEHTLEDGPQGVGDGMAGVTAFPTALTAAQSWDPALLYEFGKAVGEEHFAKGVSVMLGPGTNLIRVPWNGRAWEYYSESETLSAAAVSAVVRGVQDNSNVSVCVKHYLANSQEFDRNGEDARIAQRPLRELYSYAYRAAVEAGAGSFMLGVNKVNGLENSANAATLGILFDAGFEGWFVTDWAGIMVPNASAAALAGTSVEMPTGYQYQYLPQFIANGSLPVSVIDGLVTRVLTTAAALGLLDTPADPARGPAAAAATPAHAALARTLAARGAVLLKNANSALPLAPADAALRRGILVLGDEATVAGCGSGNVRQPPVASPYAALYDALNPHPARSGNCTYQPNVDYFQDGAPCQTVAAAPANGNSLSVACCAACSAAQGCSVWTLVPNQACPGQEPMAGATGQCFLKRDTAGFRPHGGIVSGLCAPLPPSTPPLFYLPNATGNVSGAAALARGYDAVVVVAALPVAEPDPGCEGSDRTTLALPAYDALIAAVAAANARTIVVTRTGGAALMPWLGAVAAVVHTGLAGQEAGRALADVLLGAENPGGKLTVSFPRSDNATWLTSAEQYPGVLNASDKFYRAWGKRKAP